MKLNNKGFALTSIIYMLIVLFLMIMLLILANLAQRKVVLDKIKNDVKTNLNQGGVLASSKMIVTFDPQGGEINQTTKEVTYNELYGELPTPTREGYTFKAWRGKNMFDKEVTPYKTSCTMDPVATENCGTPAAEFSIYQIDIKPNTTYTITNSGQSYNPGYAIFDSNGSTIAYESYNGRSVVTFTTLSNASYIRFTVVTSPNSYRYDKDYFQLEEGSTATSYEPYEEYTSNTIVTKQENHTLYAMWKKEYTITNLVQNGSFENDFDNWERAGYVDSTLEHHSINSNYTYRAFGSKSLARLANDTANKYFIQQTNIPFVAGHKYYFFEYVYTESTTQQRIISDVSSRTGSGHSGYIVKSDGWKKLSSIYTCENTETRSIAINYAITTDTTYIDGIGMIDLTEAFGEGSEPSKEWCDANIEYFDGTTTIPY